METSITKFSQNVIPTTLDLVGKGGFGKVYKTYSELDNKIYAIKKIIITKGSIDYSIKEIRVLASLNHKNIIRYYNSWIETKKIDPSFSFNEDNSEDDEDDEIIIQENNRFYLCIKMEYCVTNLYEYLKKRNNLEKNHHYFIQIIRGVKYLHKNNIIHRDLKPENILITENDHIKISDFGLVKTLEADNKFYGNCTTYAGTLLYASPEQYNGKKYSFETDLYSLGIILFEMENLFTTDMERYEKILLLRNKSIIDIQIKHYDIILKLCGKPALRPSISDLYQYFYKNPKESLIICRDIIWEIICKNF